MSHSNAKGSSLVQRSGPKITKGENEISQTKTEKCFLYVARHTKHKLKSYVLYFG